MWLDLLDIFDNFLITLIFLIIPGIANISPVIFRKLNFLNYPIDFGFKFDKHYLFGKNKTWRGLFFGVFFGALITGLILWFLFKTTTINIIPNLKNLPFERYIIFVLGLGFFALLGDLIKSFFKRRVGIGSGKSWFGFDQIDWIVGAVVWYFLWFGYAKFLLFVLPVGFILHLLIKFIGFSLRVDDKPI